MRLDGRLRRLSYSLKQAVVVSQTDSSSIGIGSSVTLSDGKKEVTYRIVGDLEAKPTEGKISLLSPTGRAIAGRKVGENVIITTPSGQINYIIRNIST